MENQQQLTRYLLGQLDEPDMVELEDRYFRDREVFDRLEAAFDDLTDAYVRGELSPEDRRQFGQRYVSTADGRSRIAFSRALSAYPRPLARPVSVARVRPSLVRALAELLRQQAAPVQVVAATSVLVLLAAPPYLMTRAGRLATEVDRLHRDLSEQTAAAVGERKHRLDLERRLTQLSTVSFDLLPGAVRSGGTTVLIAQSASYVRLSLATESGTPGSPLNVAILNVGGATIWSQVLPDTTRNAAPVVIVPASIFTPGEYQVHLSALKDGGRLEELATYSFRVRRR